MASKENPNQQSFDLEQTFVDNVQKKDASTDEANAEKAVNVADEPAKSPCADSIEQEPPAQTKSTAEVVLPAPASVIEVTQPELSPAPPVENDLSNKETREIVTPYAFTVSPDLLGQRLATPLRRGVAILIDLFLISVLSSLSALFFAGFVAMTFFKAGDRLKQQKRFNVTRLFLRGSAAFLIFAIVFSIVSDLGEDNSVPLSRSEQIIENEETMKSLLDLAAELIDVSCKSDSECLLNYAEGVAIGAAAMKIPVEDINATTNDIISQKDWSEENKSLFMNTFLSTLNEERNAYTDEILEITQANDTAKQSSTVYSAIEWVKGLMSDLGLGLGWAALYFSVFTAWWRGQTIGKKIVGIEVVKLDGKYPSLWESFGRYGGYGAGFATGLLGFLQIYWDPNRQAIQDKISETLVLRLKP